MSRGGGSARGVGPARGDGSTRGDGADPGAGSDPHAGGPVRREGSALGDAGAALILLHGRGGSPEDMIALAREWRAPGMAVLAPMAARRTWYPYSFMAPVERNEPHLSSALRRVATLIEDAGDAGLPRDRILLAGFSQGACLASEFVCRNPARYGGLAALSGGLIGPAGTTWDGAAGLDGTPVFLGCSDRDPHIPEERVRESARVLEGAGADVDLRIYEAMGHTVNRDEIEAVQGMIDALAGERRA